MGSPLANASRYDRDHDVKEGVLGAGPSATPTNVPTAPATTEPNQSGTKIFKKPLIRTCRSMPKILPTITAAIPSTWCGRSAQKMG
jgi:hypothetical protein